MAFSPAIILIWSVWIILMLIIGIIIYTFFTWNIPVIILRYQGDKRRPQVVITKGKRHLYAGISRLWVRGYKLPIRDFKSEFYYPSKKGKNGALILWEVKPGLLTPTIPKKIKGLRKKEYQTILAEFKRYHEALTGLALKDVDFEYNHDLYKSIVLKSIDDTDIDWMLQNYARIDTQYVTGWRDFLARYGGHIVLVLIVICLLVGFIIWLDKSPELMASCSAAAQEQATNVLKEFSGQLGSGSPPV